MSPGDILRADLKLITELVPESSRVLDLGCGDGALMAHLRDEKGCAVQGIELSPQGIAAAIEQGLSVVQADLDEGLGAYPDASFDVVVLSQTLQVVRRPDFVIGEIARVGRAGIVSFPNFAHWKVRGYLALKGRMPVAPAIPYEWYDTPNIHHTTIPDFRALCARLGLVIEREIPLSADGFGGVRRVRVLPNLLADTALAVVRRDGEAARVA
jgi:methionine biosynthesis protein MetW